MRLLRATEVTTDTSGLLCFQSRLAGFLRFMIFTGAAAFVIFWGWESETYWLLAFGIVIEAILFPWLLIDFLAMLRATNWVLRIASDGIWINLRSYRDKDIDSATVVQLDFREIASTCRRTEKYSTPSERADRMSHGAVGGDTLFRDKYLEFQLTHDQTDELRNALNKLRSTDWEPSTKMKVRHVHYPVWLAGRSVIRIPWVTGHGHAVAPRLSRVLGELETSVPVTAPTVRERPNWRKMSADDALELARELIHVHGDGFSATDLLVRAGGVTYAEATRLVREMSLEEVGPPVARP